MSVFSIIRPLPRPGRAAYPVDDWDDPLVDAWEQLEFACRVEFVDSTPEVWRREFARILDGVVMHVLAHAGKFRASTSPLKTMWAGAESMASSSGLSDHTQLLEMASSLAAQIQETNPITPGSVLEFVERAIALQIAIARHQNRLVDALESAPTWKQTEALAGMAAVRAG